MADTEGDKEQYADEGEVPVPNVSVGKVVAGAILQYVSTNWFLIGVALAVGTAALAPELGREGGHLRSEYTIKYGAVVVFFFCSGLSLESQILCHAAKRCHLHILTQAISLGFTPLLGWLIGMGLRKAGLYPALVNGFVIAASMPPTTSSSVIFTERAGGSTPLALINAVLGNAMGLLITPTLLVGFLGRSGQAPVSHILLTLGLTVLAPLLGGQILRFTCPSWSLISAAVDKLGGCMILLIIWSSFSDAFSQKMKVHVSSMIVIVAVDLALLMTLVGTCLSLAYIQPVASWLKISRADAIAIMYVGATKTIALGIPLMNSLYPETSHVLAVPLMVYYAEQCLIGSALLGPLRTWKEVEDKRGSTELMPV